CSSRAPASLSRRSCSSTSSRCSPGRCRCSSACACATTTEERAIVTGSEVAPGVHRVEEDLGPRFMAQYVLTGSERTVLVDSGLSETFDTAIAPYLASIG